MYEKTPANRHSFADLCLAIKTDGENAYWEMSQEESQPSDTNVTYP